MTGPAHVLGPIDVPLLADTIPAMFDRVVAAHPDRDALVAPFQHVRLSYRELAEQVDRVARGLLALGVQPGDRVGMWSPNNVEWVYVQFAAASVGAVLVNLNPAYRTDELVYAVTQSECRVLISARRFKTSDYTAMVAEAREQLPDVEHVVFLDTRDWDDMLAAGEGVRPTELAARHHTMSAHDPVNIQYTSGTTGSPKGATLSHHNLVNNGYFVGASFGYTERDRVCIPVPFYHCFGTVIGNLAAVTRGDDRAPGGVVRRPGDAADDPGRIVHQRARRADDVHQHAHPPGIRRVRPVHAADRDDGRRTMPDRSHETGR